MDVLKNCLPGPEEHRSTFECLFTRGMFIFSGLYLDFCHFLFRLFSIDKREVNTNQRVYFDIESNGRYVLSGSTDGSVAVWDLNQSGQNGHLLKSAHFQKYGVINILRF